MNTPSAEDAKREELILKFMGFATNIAAKESVGLPLTMEEAISAAHNGLVEAAARFDFAKFDPTIGDLETNFKSFAYLRIYGSVIDESRAKGIVKRRGLEKGHRVQMLSLDAPSLNSSAEGGSPSDSRRIELEALTDDPDLAMDFRAAFETLNDREQRVVMGLAVGAKGKELAEEFQVTQSRISQIASEARHKLLTYMEG